MVCQAAELYRQEQIADPAEAPRCTTTPASPSSASVNHSPRRAVWVVQELDTRLPECSLESGHVIGNRPPPALLEIPDRAQRNVRVLRQFQLRDVEPATGSSALFRRHVASSAIRAAFLMALT